MCLIYSCPWGKYSVCKMDLFAANIHLYCRDDHDKPQSKAFLCWDESWLPYQSLCIAHTHRYLWKKEKVTKVWAFLSVLIWQYHGSFSLQHWLQQADWLPTLEATLALDEESVRRVGDDSVGGPAISRQLRLIRILMRDLLIGVCYITSGYWGCNYLLTLAIS